MEIGKAITCFETDDREKVIMAMYKNESSEWHQQTHKNGGTAEENIQSTLDTIEPDSFYSVYMGAELAGYFSKFQNEQGQALDAFHIGKKFRTKEFIPQFWAKVKKVFKTDFVIGIYEKNEPALKHLLRQGFIIQNKIEIGDEKIVILNYKF